mmetsp:Transcript_9678/g.13574  ORF Transcript_9678/g.13574 Transcript_9678/m.13574 type:complete len:226 (+) Transcript_9678:438-1115(+)
MAGEEVLLAHDTVLVHRLEGTAVDSSLGYHHGATRKAETARGANANESHISCLGMEEQLRDLVQQNRHAWHAHAVVDADDGSNLVEGVALRLADGCECESSGHLESEPRDERFGKALSAVGAAPHADELGVAEHAGQVHAAGEAQVVEDVLVVTLDALVAHLHHARLLGRQHRRRRACRKARAGQLPHTPCARVHCRARVCRSLPLSIPSLLCHLLSLSLLRYVS